MAKRLIATGKRVMVDAIPVIIPEDPNERIRVALRKMRIPGIQTRTGLSVSTKFMMRPEDIVAFARMIMEEEFGDLGPGERADWVLASPHHTLWEQVSKLRRMTEEEFDSVKELMNDELL